MKTLLIPVPVIAELNCSCGSSEAVLNASYEEEQEKKDKALNLLCVNVRFAAALQ